MRKAVFFILILIHTQFLLAENQETVVIDVNLDMKHSVGGISEFDRSKFVNIHSDLTDNEWDGSNEISDLRDDFLNGYDVYLGRNTGGITWQLNSVLTEDPARPGYVDPTSIESNGQQNIQNYAAKTQLHPFEFRNDQILCAQLHPFWPDGQKTNKGWSFSQADTDQEPIGTATGEYMGRYLKNYYGNGGTSGEKRPNIVEVINEPLWHLVDYGNEQPEKVFRFHNAVASQIRKFNQNVLIGGYCVAFPDLEKNNFQQWQDRWKLFMDIAGANMDFWSIHLYDFPSINQGKQLYRKGAQMEATLDMMEQYSYLKFGKAKPFLVSEFGAQMHDYADQWSPYRDWLHMKSVNSMMIQFMQRPDHILKAINFLIVKAEWGYDAKTGRTYQHRLLRKANEPASYTGNWVYTDMVKLYQLWSDVKGVRVDAKSANPDILSDVYVNGNKVYLIANNLDIEKAYDIKFNLQGSDLAPSQIKIKQLHLQGDVPVLDEENYTSMPESITIGSEATVILECSYPENLSLTETSAETKYYANEFLQPIVSNTDINFNIANVSKANYGEATLRIGIGRAHGKELFPEVSCNGQILEVVKNYRGDNQTDRNSFFGVLEVNVPYEALQESNQIHIKFPDTGGYVSSLSMQVYNFSRPVERTSASLPTAIHSLDKSDLKLYPIPAKQSVTLMSSARSKASRCDIFDMNGKMVKTQVVQNTKQQISLNHLHSGLYLVRIHTKDGIQNRKLMIQN